MEGTFCNGFLTCTLVITHIHSIFVFIVSLYLIYLVKSWSRTLIYCTEKFIIIIITLVLTYLLFPSSECHGWKQVQLNPDQNTATSPHMPTIPLLQFHLRQLVSSGHAILLSCPGWVTICATWDENSLSYSRVYQPREIM